MNKPRAFPDQEGSGMSLRDYFAGQAVIGHLAAYNDTADPDPEIAARTAYKYADAMLKAREEGK